MQTVVLPIDPDHPDRLVIEQAAEVLSRGGLVVIPTETVYGLAANALQAEAVQRIFTAKGRPSQNPVIVHVVDEMAAQSLVRAWPERATRLCQAFWPGPLTIVLPRSELIPDIVTASGSTVALRSPAHPVARALLMACPFPLAAPSANRSSSISPTKAEHVLKDLNGLVELILDAGPCAHGLESTVVDLAKEPPCILRPGPIGPEELLRVITDVRWEIRPHAATEKDASIRSPGQLSRHYAPKTELHLLPADQPFWKTIHQACEAGQRVGLLYWGIDEPLPSQPNLIIDRMPASAKEYGKVMYDRLHAMDAHGLNVLFVLVPPKSEEWLAIRDRLTRAAVANEPDATGTLQRNQE